MKMTIQKIPLPDSGRAAVMAGGWLNVRDRILEAHSTNHQKLLVKGSNGLPINVGGHWFYLESDIFVDMTADLDTGALLAGKDYCIYACYSSGSLVFKVSLAATFPAGFTSANSRKIGGCHTLCLAVGVISGHSLSGYVAKDVIPASIWDLRHRPRCEPAGMVFAELAGIWVDIYLASGTGTNTVSANGGTISDNRSWLDFVDDFAAVKKKLLDDTEFQIIAAGSNEETNITGSADPVTTGGHVDTAGRRMVSNIGVEDACGAMWQWLLDQSFRCDPDGTVQSGSKTGTITHVASPGGNPIYIKFFNDGTPYLCCNMASATANKIITLGTDYKLQITHDASAATGGLQVYFDEDATQPSRLLCNNSVLSKDCYVATNNPVYALQVKHSANSSTLGVAVNYDDGADNRLEFASPTSANGTLDLALNSQAFGYYDLPGSKGSLYRQGTYGDVKLLAGGAWPNGTACGSRSRSAITYRWSATSAVGARGRSEPL